MNLSEPAVVIAGGWTGGHVFPALAVGAALRRDAPDCRLLFVGSEGGLEADLVPRAGFDIELLSVGKLKGSALRVRLKTLAGLLPAVAAAAASLRRFQPKVVVGVGGFASAPVTMAATLLRLPVVLLEQNSVPGLTNRALSRLARTVVAAFACSADYFPAGKVELLGNPVRPDLQDALLSRTRAPGDFDDKGPCLVVLGGSQGAHAVNELVASAAPHMAAHAPNLRVIHQTGQTDEQMVNRAYAEADIDAEVHAFVHDMAPLYLQADLMLGRAGATTIAELTVAGVPALFVPYPFAADDHQQKNADELVQAGAALNEAQANLTPDSLGKMLVELLTDPARLGAMSAAMKSRAKPNAARDVAKLVLEM